MIGTISHVAICLAAQLVLAWSIGSYWLGAITGTCFYLGREVAQAENRWSINVGNRYGPSVWRKLRAFDPRAWNAKGLADWMLPAAATSALAVFMG